MRIRNINIASWRNFENISLNLEDDTALVCVVGANGTGKSHLLELIAACAHRLGLSPGSEIPRGDPFGDPHQFSLEIYLAPGVSSAVDKGLSSDANFTAWDRTLTISSISSDSASSTTFAAGGIADGGQRAAFAEGIIGALKQSKDVHFLSLDADRAYPKKSMNIHEIAQAYDTNWETEEYTRGRSFRPSSTLYDEWIKYFLALENQSGTKFIQQTRRAREARQPDPTFTDHFDAYKTALKRVLPHLVFSGVDPQKKTLLFDTTGMELAFNQLSGGEREIAFLIGQIDRFGLRQGLLLLDEPELHLNADLIRAWVSYLTGAVETGQIWVATHSLEAVEAAGQTATFVLERDDETKKVDNLARLDARPVLSALSRAVGTPAFSLSQLKFVFVEGEESVGERERFRQLAGLPGDVRFIECGSCNEVIRRVDAVKSLAHEAEGGLRIGGVVDRDYRKHPDVTALQSDYGIHVLPVHEVENLFLHPATVQALLEQNGRSATVAADLIQDLSDARAGSWMFQNAMSSRNALSLPDISSAAKDQAKSKPWSAFETDEAAVIAELVQASGYIANDQCKLRSLLEISCRSYGRKRSEADLWKFCEGKQVLPEVARQAGYSGKEAMTQAVFAAWKRDSSLLPGEVTALRTYLASL